MNKKYTKLVLLTLVCTFALFFPIFPYVKGDDTEDFLDWGVDDINAEMVWGGFDGATDIIDGNPSGDGVKILHIDTGIKFGRIYDRIDKEDLEYVDYIDGGRPDDTNGHGTATAGVIWMPDDGHGYIGVAPNAKQYIFRLEDNPYHVVDAINWGIQKQVDVITMSLASEALIDGWPAKILLALACVDAYNAGIVLIAASGNANQPNLAWPAEFDEVIAVGAIDQSHQRWVEEGDDETFGSNYGFGLELVAPGVDIKSVSLGRYDYDEYTGTSMAAPFVAGVVALLLEMDPSLTPGEVRSILHNTALDLGEPGWDGYYGYGMVNAYHAVDNEAPEVTITSHNTGDWVKGIVSITASATDNVLVEKVAFKIDNGEWHYDTDGTDGWSYDWDSTGYTTGGHNIWSRAYDPRGLYGEAVVSVGVDNVPPSVDIINPSHSATVSGTITVTASASDDSNVEKVQFFIDSVLRYEDTNGANGWTWNWDTLTSSEDNYHYVKVKAFDIADNYAEHQHTVFVNNFPSDPGPGCPILSVFDGTDYVVEGLLDIHNPEGIDVEAIQVLSTKPEAVNDRYLLRLTEFHKTISHIDQVKLFGRLHNGQLVPLRLTSAFHSSLGQVRNWLWFSDDKRVDVYGADHIEGGSEFIDLKFIAPAHTNFVEFIFFIEGNNRLIK